MRHAVFRRGAYSSYALVHFKTQRLRSDRRHFKNRFAFHFKREAHFMTARVSSLLFDFLLQSIEYRRGKKLRHSDLKPVTDLLDRRDRRLVPLSVHNII